MRYEKIKGIVFLFLCLLLVFSQKPLFSSTLRKNSSLPSLPSEFVSLTYHIVDTVNGNVSYINETHHSLRGSNLYITKQLIFVQAELYQKSKDSIVGFGIGFRRYTGSSGLTRLWYGGSVSIVNVFNLETVARPASVTGLSGLLTGNIGCTWFFEERLALEILVGLTWPSLYRKPGMPDDLYASPFFGLGLSFVL
jgi:hypothetical protein